LRRLSHGIVTLLTYKRALNSPISAGKMIWITSRFVRT